MPRLFDQVVGRCGGHLTLETAEAGVALEQGDERLGNDGIELQLAALASGRLDGAAHGGRPSHRQAAWASDGGGVAVVVEVHLVERLLVHKPIDEAQVCGPEDEPSE